MAQVKLNATSLSSIRRQIEKMESESEAAQKKVQSAINGLDFEVSSKHNIRSSLNKIKNSLDKQAQGAINYRTAFTNVTNSLIDTDNKFESESKGILDKIKDFVEDAVGAVKTFFVKNKLAKIAAVSGLFLFHPSVASWAITVEVLKGIAEWWSRRIEEEKKKEEENRKKEEQRQEEERKKREEEKQREEEERIRQEKLKKANALETIKQPYSGPCPQYATLNLLRRKQVIDGGEATLTIQNVKDSNGGLNRANWVSDMCGYSMEVERGQQLKGSKSKVTIEYFNELLKTHPEGVVIYSIYDYSTEPKGAHAITITGYDEKTNQYTVMDSADTSSCKGVDLFENSWSAKKWDNVEDMIVNCNKIYYIR